MIGADLDEIAGGVAAEKFADEGVLFVGCRMDVAMRDSAGLRLALLRDFSTMRVVLKPGTRSTRITSPPCASTTSRPTTWSGR